MKHTVQTESKIEYSAGIIKEAMRVIDSTATDSFIVWPITVLKNKEQKPTLNLVRFVYDWNRSYKACWLNLKPVTAAGAFKSLVSLNTALVTWINVLFS